LLIKERILLINPPIIDSRYPWIKWNQPLELLKFSTYLKEELECQVKLFDFLLPSHRGVVPKRRSKIDSDLPDNEPIQWVFGQSWEVFDTYIDSLLANQWIPDTVWITTLTSFWWQAIPLLADRIKNKLRQSNIILYGNYPNLFKNHAYTFCPSVDVITSGYLDIATLSADISLYEKHKLNHIALDIRSSDPIGELTRGMDIGVSHFVFFNDNIFLDFTQRLKPILDEVVKKGWDIRFHGICGIDTNSFPLDYANLFAKAHFSELHFEPALDEKGKLNEPLYRDVMKSCELAGFVQRRGEGWESKKFYLSGFLWIGRPDDQLDDLIANALKLLQLVGMVIPKPYTPIPGTNEFLLLGDDPQECEPHKLSPHRFPFAGKNGIDKSEYEDFYRLTALLNMKVRAQTFDFLGNSFLAKTIRESLLGQRWNIPRN